MIIAPGHSAHGRTIFGRVLDYPGVNLYDAYPLIYYIAQPGRNRYVTVTTGGLAAGALTAMNEHGLTLSVHSVLSLDATAKGSPLMSVTTHMMEYARTIEEAAAICNQRPTAASWLMNLVDVRNGVPRAARLESSPTDRRCSLTFAPGDSLATNDDFKLRNRTRQPSLGPTFDADSAYRLGAPESPGLGFRRRHLG